jgi:putative hydrolase of the HAD superfamily
MIKAVFFDFFNTLVNYHPPREQLQAAACREFGIEVKPQALREALFAGDQFYDQDIVHVPMSKRSEAERMALYAKYEAKVLEAVGVEVSEELALQIMAKFGTLMREAGARFVLFDDAEPALAQLKGRGLTLGLISNIDRDLSSTYEELGLSSFLDVLVTSLAVGAAKPDLAIFRAALERAGVDASDAIHVGDMYHSDVMGARNAGIRPLLIDRDGLHQEISDCPRISSLGEVSGYL